MKKIVLVANTTWNIYNFRLNLIEKFLQEGFEVNVVAPIDEYLEYKEKYPQVKHFGLRYLRRNSKNPLLDILLTLELARRYRILQPDIVVHFTNKPNIYGAFASKLAKVKSIGVVTGLGYAFIHNGLIKKISTYLYKLSAKFHEKIIFENIEDKELFLQLGIVSEENAISVKGCGVNIDYYQPKVVDKKSESTIFTFIGRLLYDKGIREFVAAAKLVRLKNSKTEFWVIGELDAENPATIVKEDLLQWIDDETIMYFGFQKDIRKLVSNSDCIVLPSYREGNPRTITEGMSMGKAVITSDIGGCRENVEEGKNGYLVPLKNVDALASAMLKFSQLTDAQKHSFGENGRQKVINEFNDKQIANHFFECVASILEKYD